MKMLDFFYVFNKTWAKKIQIFNLIKKNVPFYINIILKIKLCHQFLYERIHIENRQLEIVIGVFNIFCLIVDIIVTHLATLA